MEERKPDWRTEKQKLKKYKNRQKINTKETTILLIALDSRLQG